MSSVEIRYIQSLGRARYRAAKHTPDWPFLLLNPRDQQAHNLGQSPVFVLNKPRKVGSLKELQDLEPPPPTIAAGKLVAICEDNSLYPLAPSLPYTREEMADEGEVLHREGMNMTFTRASRDDLGRTLLAPAFMGLVGVAALLTVLLAFLIVTNVYLDKDSSPPPTTSAGQQTP